MAPGETSIATMADPLVQTFLLIGGAFLGVLLLTRIRLSPIIGYVAAGLLLGPHGLGAIPEGEGTHLFGDLGVALLMFVIGLEFSFPRLIAAGGSVFGLGIGTVAAVAAAVALPAHYLAGIPMIKSTILGGAIAMSSTAIVHKQLVDADEVSSLHGIAATAIVLFEDLVALTVLAVVGALHTGTGQPLAEDVIIRMAISLSALAVVALLARRTIGKFLELVAKSRLNETFLLAVLTLIVGASLAAQAIGLSLPIGAFVVGMIVGESDFRHQLEDEIRPFRDLLVGVFFITVGMSLDWSQVTAQPGITAGILTAIVVVKFVVVSMVVRISGSPAHSAIKTGLLLAHSGELGLLIVERSLATSLLPGSVGQPILGAIAASMLIGPLLAQFRERIASAVSEVHSAELPSRHEESVRASSADLLDHVVLAGCGPVGRLVAITLEASKVPYIAVERNIERLRRAQNDGHKAVFGDATRSGILKAAGIQRAAAIVILVNDWRRSVRIIQEAKHLNPDIQVIASLRDDAHLGALVRAGASHIFPENFAAGLGLAAQALMSLGVAPAEAMDRIRAIRAALSPELRLLPS